jgi:hypothetical protein
MRGGNAVPCFLWRAIQLSFVPKEQLKIARLLKADMTAASVRVPKGRLKIQPSLRDSTFCRNPGVETPGFFPKVPPGQFQF